MRGRQCHSNMLKHLCHEFARMHKRTEGSCHDDIATRRWQCLHRRMALAIFKLAESLVFAIEINSRRCELGLSCNSSVMETRVEYNRMDPKMPFCLFLRQEDSLTRSRRILKPPAGLYPCHILGVGQRYGHSVNCHAELRGRSCSPTP